MIKAALHRMMQGCFWSERDSLFCGKATEVATCHRHVAKFCISVNKAREDGFVYIFIPGRNENRGVDAVKPASSNCPPDSCI
jgi:hypothetical protein